MSPPDAGLDQVARDAATRALGAIETHVQVCLERQKHIDALLTAASEQRRTMADSMERMRVETRDAIRGLYKQQWVALGTVVAVLLSAVGFLIVQLWAMR